MPLTIPQENLNGWKKFSNNFYFYPTDGHEDGDNHIHVIVVNATSKPMEVKSVSIKIAGKSTNLAVGNPITKFKFKPSTATWPPDPVATRYKTALKNAGIID